MEERIRLQRWPILACAVAASAASTPGAPATAQDLRLARGFDLNSRLTGSLAIFGVVAVPNEAASTLTLNSDSGEGYDFTSGQVGGSFTVSKSFPLYLEGFVGYARYDPVVVFSDGSRDSLLPLKWTIVGGTAGAGWDFALTDRLTLRPIANVSLGYIASDAALLSRYVESRLDADLDFLEDGELTAGGFGGAMMLDYEYVSPEYEIDSELRYSHMVIQPILGDRSFDASADAITVGWWNRLRVPTGLQALGGPLRAVLEGSAGLYPGDQGEVLQTDWLLQTGVGLELDFSNSPIPGSRGRVMARYAFGEQLTGFSIGLAVSF